MEITGVIHEVGDVIQVTDKFKKRELIVQYADNPQFVEYIKFEAHQDRVNLFDNLNEGDEVTVAFNLKGKEWTSKVGQAQYFNSLVAWKVNKVTATETTPKSKPMSADDLPPIDDLPF